VIAERRKLYEELYNLYCLLNISRMIISEWLRWAEHIAYMREMTCMQNFSWKPEGKRPRRRSRHRWKDNNTVDLKEISCEDVDWDVSCKIMPFIYLKLLFVQTSLCKMAPWRQMRHLRRY
jgi:hypothetical protein